MARCGEGALRAPRTSGDAHTPRARAPSRQDRREHRRVRRRARAAESASEGASAGDGTRPARLESRRPSPCRRSAAALSSNRPRPRAQCAAGVPRVMARVDARAGGLACRHVCMARGSSLLETHSTGARLVQLCGQLGTHAACTAARRVVADSTAARVPARLADGYSKRSVGHAAAEARA